MADSEALIAYTTGKAGKEMGERIEALERGYTEIRRGLFNAVMRIPVLNIERAESELKAQEVEDGDTLDATGNATEERTTVERDQPSRGSDTEVQSGSYVVQIPELPGRGRAEGQETSRLEDGGGNTGSKPQAVTPPARTDTERLNRLEALLHPTWWGWCIEDAGTDCMTLGQCLVESTAEVKGRTLRDAIDAIEYAGVLSEATMAPAEQWDEGVDPEIRKAFDRVKETTEASRKLRKAQDADGQTAIVPSGRKLADYTQDEAHPQNAEQEDEQPTEAGDEPRPEEYKVAMDVLAMRLARPESSRELGSDPSFREQADRYVQHIEAEIAPLKAEVADLKRQLELSQTNYDAVQKHWTGAREALKQAEYELGAACDLRDSWVATWKEAEAACAGYEKVRRAARELVDDGGKQPSVAYGNLCEAVRIFDRDQTASPGAEILKRLKDAEAGYNRLITVGEELITERVEAEADRDRLQREVERLNGALERISRTREGGGGWSRCVDIADRARASQTDAATEAWVPHVIEEGSREHVVRYDTQGAHCSEPRCEMNRPTEGGTEDADAVPDKGEDE